MVFTSQPNKVSGYASSIGLLSELPWAGHCSDLYSPGVLEECDLGRGNSRVVEDARGGGNTWMLFVIDSKVPRRINLGTI